MQECGSGGRVGHLPGRGFDPCLVLSVHQRILRQDTEPRAAPEASVWVHVQILDVCTHLHTSEKWPCTNLCVIGWIKGSIKCFEGSIKLEKHFISTSPFTIYKILSSVNENLMKFEKFEKQPWRLWKMLSVVNFYVKEWASCIKLSIEASSCLSHQIFLSVFNFVVLASYNWCVWMSVQLCWTNWKQKIDSFNSQAYHKKYNGETWYKGIFFGEQLPAHHQPKSWWRN